MTECINFGARDSTPERGNAPENRTTAYMYYWYHSIDTWEDVYFVNVIKSQALESLGNWLYLYEGRVIAAVRSR